MQVARTACMECSKKWFDCCALSYEKEFAILGQCPHLVLYDEFEFVDVISNGVKVGCDFVVISYGKLAHILYFVDNLALLNHGFNVFSYEADVLVDFFDEVDVVGCEFFHLGGVGECGLYFAHIVYEFALVLGGDGDDVIHAKVSENACLNLYFLLIGFPFDFVSGLKLVAVHDVHAFKHLHAVGIKVAVENDGAGCLAVQSTAGCLFLPLIAIAVAVEVNRLANLDVLTNDLKDGRYFVLALCDESVYTGLEILESLSHSGVEHNHCAGAVGYGTDGAELEAVAGEGERRGAVAVGVVNHEFGYLWHVELHAVLSFQGEELVGGRVLHLVEEFAHLLSEEAGDDGGRCFVGAQAVSVRCAHDRGLEQTVVLVYAHQCLDNEHDEAEVVLGCLAWAMKQSAGVCGEAPVVVLTRAVDSCKWLFVEQAAESVLAGYLTHQRHDEHVVVDGQIAFFKDGGEFKLVGGYLVVTCFAGDAEFECLNLEVTHEFLHTFGDGAEVMVVHLLILC